MLLKKQKNKEKYLAGKVQIRALSAKFHTWQFDNLLDLLECSYKISHFFYTYYKSFQIKASKRLLELQNKTNKGSYILWRIISAVSISHTLEIYKTLNVNLGLKDIKGESFYGGIPQITQKEIDIAIKIRALYQKIQPVMKYGVKCAIKEKYGEFNGDYSVKGYDNINEIENIKIPGLCGTMSFCPAIIMEDGKYHIWNR